jgi:Predicted membrane protein (DUF2306)
MTKMQMLPYKKVSKADWLIPVGLLAISFIPIVAGVLRVAPLAAGTAMTPENARFVAAPIPVVLHIIGATLFSVLGAFQFSTGLRQRHPQWHKVSGRVVAASGVVAALSGMWMSVIYPIPAALQGDLLLGVRLLAGAAMLMAIVIAVTAAMNREFAKHRAWMIRGYALGQGAGMQVVVLLPWMLIVGTPGALLRDVLMSLAWLINLAIAEMIIQKPSFRFLCFYKATP